MIGQVYFSLHCCITHYCRASARSLVAPWARWWSVGIRSFGTRCVWDVAVRCNRRKNVAPHKFSRRSKHLIKESETELETFFQFCTRIRILQHHLTIFNMSKWLWLFDSVCGSYIQLNHHEEVKLFLRIGQLTMSQLWYVDQQRPQFQAQKALKSYGEALHQLANRKQERGLWFFLFGWVKPILTSSCCCCGFKILWVGTLFWDLRFSQVDKTSFEGFAFVSWWEIHGKCCHVWCFAMGENVWRIHPSWKRWMNGSSRQSPRRTRYHSDTSIDESSMPTTANALMYALLRVGFFSYLMNAYEEQKLWIAVTKVCLVQAYLVKVMEWKLTRGTFRPGLLQKVQQNSEEEVKTSFTSLACVFANPFAYIHEGKTCRNNNWESNGIHGFIMIYHYQICQPSVGLLGTKHRAMCSEWLRFHISTKPLLKWFFSPAPLRTAYDLLKAESPNVAKAVKACENPHDQWYVKLTQTLQTTLHLHLIATSKHLNLTRNGNNIDGYGRSRTE